MQNRRDFLKQASMLLAGGLVAPQLLSSCAEKKHIGLQLYSLREVYKCPFGTGFYQRKGSRSNELVGPGNCCSQRIGG